MGRLRTGSVIDRVESWPRALVSKNSGFVCVVVAWQRAVWCPGDWHCECSNSKWPSFSTCQRFGPALEVSATLLRPSEVACGRWCCNVISTREGRRGGQGWLMSGDLWLCGGVPIYVCG